MSQTNLSHTGRVQDDSRGKWSRKIEYMLSLIGYCVGLGNLWRFPYICTRHGGGAFLIPYLFFLVFCGLPLYFLETAIGQFSGKGPVHVWSVCPLLKGLGIAMVIPVSICNVYYNTILLWTLYYIGNSFKSPLPWTTCDNSWNSPSCISNRGTYEYLKSLNKSEFNNKEQLITATSNITTVDNGNVTWLTSQEDFWQKNVLQISSGIEDIGHLSWYLVLCLIGAWIIVGLCIIKGVKSVGKVVYLTATLPYVLLTLILIRGLTLDGSIDGVVYYLKPDFNKILNFQVWMEAAVQVFFSLGPCWGPLISMSSFNKFDNNCLRDSTILTFACEGTSIYAGLVIFTVLGFMAKKFSIPIEKVVKSGPGLGFIAYPEALAQLPGENVWSVMFFLMLLAVGLDTQFAGCENVILAFTDNWPSLRRRRTLLTVLFCGINLLLGLIFCSQAGIYVFQLVDWYVVAFALPLFGFLECMIFGWIYGADRFSRDVKLMLGRGVPVFMRICICFITPSILLILFVCGIVFYTPPTYGVYKYPDTAIVCGFIIALIPLLPLIVCAIKVLIESPGNTIKEKFLYSLRPSSEWRPIAMAHQPEYGNGNDMHEQTLLEEVKLNGT